jgi:gliding motility-associated-like protein
VWENLERIVKKLTIILVTTCLWLSGLAQVSFSVNEAEGCAPHPVIINVVTPDPNAITSYFWEITYPDNTVETSTAAQYIDIFSQPGTYDVSLTVNGNQSGTVEGFVTVYQPPQAQFSVSDDIGCVPHCASFTDESIVTGGEIVEWSWDLGGGNVSTEQNPSICYQNPGVFTPVLSIEDEFGCFSSISIPEMVTVVDEYPVTSFTPSSFSDCSPPATFDFVNNSSGDDITSTWDFDDGFTQTTVTPTDISHTFDDFGSYDVCLSVTDAIGCTVDSCATIEIIPSPQPTFTVSESELCAGGTVIFESTSVPQPQLIEWDFDGDGTIDATGDLVAFEYAQQGFFNPVAFATYSATCAGQSDGTLQIEVLAPLNIDFTTDISTGCASPLDVNFTNTSTGQNITGYEWLIDNQSIATTTDLAYTFTDFGLYDVSLVVNTSNCLDTLTLADHIVLQQPTITFDAPDLLCAGEDVLVTNINIQSVEDLADVLWDFNGDGVPDATGEVPSYVYDTPGVYNIEVFLETVGGCTNVIVSDQSVEVYPNAVSEFEALETEVCASDPVEFCVDNMVENTIYAWNFGDNTPWQPSAFPESCVEHDYQDTGYFDVTLSVYNQACNAILTLEDYIYIPPPIAQFDLDQDCVDLNVVQFFDDSVEADSLVWDFGDGSPLVSDVINPVHTYPGPGTYQVVLTAFNFESGCQDFTTATVQTTVDDIPLTAGNAVGCAPVTPFFNSAANTSYVLWEVDFGNGYTMVSELVGTIWEVNVFAPDGTSSFEDYTFNSNFWPNNVPYTQAGLYDVTVTATDASGCSYTQTYEDLVEVLNDLNFSEIEATIIEGCDSVLISFEATGNFITDFNWTFSDGATSTEANPVHEFLPPWDTTFAATLDASDQFGCFSQDTIVLDLVAPPIPDFSIEVTPTCIGDTIQVTNNSIGDIVEYTWDFGDPGSPTNVQNGAEPSHAYTANGSYTICLTAENSGGCAQTLCIENAVEIISPVASFSYGGQVNNCLFGVQFENTTPGNILCSQWDFGDDQLGSGITPFHTYPIGVYDVELVVCNEFGCYDTTTVEDIFNFSNVIGPYTALLDDVSCAPFQVDFSAFNTADQSFTYFWEFDDGFGDPNNNTQTSHTYTEPGEYCPSLIMEDPNGCPFLIECEEPIVVEEFSIDVTTPDPICFGDSTLIVLEGGESYQLEQPEFFSDAGDDTYYLQSPESGAFNVTGFLADCVAEATIDLIVNPLPEVALQVPAELCNDAEELVLDGGTPVGDTGVYTVDGEEATSFDPTSAPGQAYEITYAFTDDNGCTNADTSEIFIHPLPVVTLEPFDPLCEADAPLVFEGGAPLGGVYTVNEEALATFDPTTSGFGSFDVTYTFTDENSCVAEATDVLVVNAQPSADFSAENLCWEETLPLNSDAAIAEGVIADQTWTLTNGTVEQQGADALFSTADAPVTVDATLTVTSAEGCVTANTQSFEVFASPVAAFTAEDVCAGDATALIDESTSAGAPITAWNWNVNEASYGTGANPGDFSMNEWGSYDIELITTTAEGCQDSITQPVYIAPLPEAGVLFDDICAGEEAFFANTSEIASGSIDAVSWSNGLGDLLTTNDLAQSYELPGSYDLNLSLESDFGCVVDTGFTIEVYHVPEPFFSFSETSFCQFGLIDLVDESTIGGGSITAWEWTVNGDTFSQQSETQFSSDEAGVYDIGLTVSSNEGCTASLILPDAIEIWPAPVADFVYSPDDPTILAPVIYVDDRSEGAIDWFYTINDEFVDNVPDFEYNFTTPGIYTLEQFVTNIFGCTDSISFDIEVASDLAVYVPNAFTPDQDGVNEIFKPVISGADVTDYRFQIFNRWGEMIFVTDNPEQGWIGEVNGGDHFAQNGVYTWRLELSTFEWASRRVFTGHVTILR